MSTSAKLKVVSVTNHSLQYGITDYIEFKCLTENDEEIKVAVTENALRTQGINPMLVDNLVGSTIIAKDSTDIKTGVFSTGKDRVESIVNGTFENPNKPGQFVTTLLLNKGNCDIIKSDLYYAETKDLASSIQAKVQIEKAKERKLEKARTAADRYRSIADGNKVQKPVEEKVEVEDEEPAF